MHLSRLAEEIVLWVSAQFRFVTLSDKFTTGSSIMPQKRNPDAAELVRAKIGRIAGAFQGLLMVMKGLPLTYSKDMQEDKETTFDALESFTLMIAAMTGMIADLRPNEAVLKVAAGGGYATATDLADWLVRTLKMPFRDAHHVTGRIVGLAEAKGCGLEDLFARGNAGASSHGSRRTSSPFWASRIPSRAARAMGEPRHRTSSKWRETGKSAWTRKPRVASGAMRSCHRRGQVPAGV